MSVQVPPTDPEVTSETPVGRNWIAFLKANSEIVKYDPDRKVAMQVGDYIYLPYFSFRSWSPDGPRGSSVIDDTRSEVRAVWGSSG